MTATKKPMFSIIIPSKNRNEKLNECIRRCLKLKNNAYEVIVLVENETNFQENPRHVRLIVTGPKSAGEKRNIGVKSARGSFIAFIDDDAFPREDWLTNAGKYFENEKISAVGGPHLTPESDDTCRKASGFVLGSYIGGGSLSYEYTERVKKPIEVKYLASCNLIIRKSIMEKVGGFDTKYWPGEDSKLSWDVLKSGGNLLYAPDVVVYHHRRPLFKEHLQQISSYALHSGFFLKKFQGESLGIIYFIPSLFVIFLMLGFVLALLNDFVRVLYTFTLAIYLIAVFFESLKTGIKNRSLKLGIYVYFGIIVTHLFYGFFFLEGLAKKELHN